MPETPPAAGGGVLGGMRVLDLSQQLPGPYATFLLAAMGAQVTKVEPLTGDPGRHFDPQMFERVNAGKASVFLDLKSDTDRQRLYELVDASDVFVEGFRPGVTTRLGCDEATLRVRRPTLVYCSLSGMGQTGPLARNPTHDLSLQAMVGTLRDAPPSDRIGVPWVDLATGTTAALAIVAAWQARRPAYLDVAMLDAARSWSAVKPAAVHEPEATYGVLDAHDGRVAIALLEDAMWRRLCVALDWADWADDPALRTYLQRRGHAELIRRRLESAVGARSVRELLTLAHDHDLPLEAVDPALDPQAAEQLTARGREQHDAARYSNLPLELIVPLSAAPSLPGEPGLTSEPGRS